MLNPINRIKMKKLVLTIFAGLAISQAAVAQETNPQVKEQHKIIDNKEFVQKRTDSMVERYGLDEKQAAKLNELNTKFADKLGPRHGGPRMGGPRPAGGPRPEMPGGFKPKGKPEMKQGEGEGNRMPFNPEEMAKRREQMEENQKAYKSELKEILTEEQFQKYEADEAQRMERRRGFNRGEAKMPMGKSDDFKADFKEKTAKSKEKNN